MSGSWRITVDSWSTGDATWFGRRTWVIGDYPPNCGHTEHAVSGDGLRGRWFPADGPDAGVWEACREIGVHDLRAALRAIADGDRLDLLGQHRLRLHSGRAPHPDWPMKGAELEKAAHDESLGHQVPPETVLLEAIGTYGSTLTEPTPLNMEISKAMSALDDLLERKLTEDGNFCPWVDPNVDFKWACQLPAGHTGGHSCA